MEEEITTTNTTEEKKEEKLHERICPTCKQQYKTKVGLGNWKSLFRKPTLDEWITLFILIMLAFAALAYNNDTKACRETLSHLDIVCLNYNSVQKNLTSAPATNIVLNLFNSTNASS